MAKFRINAQRFDPYKNFKFRVKWGGRYVAGVSKVSALKRSSDVVADRAGRDPSSARVSPRRTNHEPVTLERGITHDSEFVTWANALHMSGAALETATAAKTFRTDVLIELYDETGRLTRSYKLHRCWVSEFQATPNLDAKAYAVAIEILKLENEGWECEFDATADAGSRDQ